MLPLRVPPHPALSLFLGDVKQAALACQLTDFPLRSRAFIAKQNPMTACADAACSGVA
jgi:hypothetical protein